MQGRDAKVVVIQEYLEIMVVRPLFMTWVQNWQDKITLIDSSALLTEEGAELGGFPKVNQAISNDVPIQIFQRPKCDF